DDGPLGRRETGAGVPLADGVRGALATRRDLLLVALDRGDEVDAGREVACDPAPLRDGRHAPDAVGGADRERVLEALPDDGADSAALERELAGVAVLVVVEPDVGRDRGAGRVVRPVVAVGAGSLLGEVGEEVHGRYRAVGCVRRAASAAATSPAAGGGDARAADVSTCAAVATPWIVPRCIDVQ